MYAIYKCISNSTAQNVASDLGKILSGTTDKNLLSASCDKNATTITSTIPAGWELYDTDVANKQQLRAPYVDDANSFKYVEIEVQSGGLYLYGYETWNQTTNTGTNKTTNTSYPQRVNLTSGFTVYLFASARYIAMISFDGTAWGDTSSNGMSIAAEYSREQPFQTIANGYPNFAILQTGMTFGGSKYVYCPRTRDVMNSDRTGANATLYMATVGCGYSGWSSNTNFPSGSNAKVSDLAENLYIPMFPLFLVDPPVYVMPLGNISSISDIWALPKDSVGHLENFMYDGLSYIAVQGSSQGFRLGFRKG